MKRLRSLALAVALLLPLGAPAFAQVTRAALQAQINSIITTNGVGAITGAKLNTILNLLLQSVPTLLDANTFAAPPIFTTLNGCLAANLTGAVTGTGSACGSGGGGGTPGGSNTQVQYNSSGSFAGVAGFTFDGTSKISLGFAGTSVGKLAFANATSGSLTLQPPTGALGSAVLTLPDATDQLVGRATTDTLTGKTISGASNTLSNIGNGSLTNPSLTVAGHSIALGGSQAIACADLSTSGTGCAAGVASGTSGQPAYYNASSASIASETLSALLDANLGSTQGSILYRGASTWSLLGPGTSGWFLKTLGASANPAWAAVSGGTGCTTSGSNGQILSDNGAGGCSSNTTGAGVLTALGIAPNTSGGVVTQPAALASLATQAANTLVANVTGSSAAPAASSLPSCSTTTSALQYTSGTGLSCNANAASLTTVDQVLVGGANVTPNAQATGSFTLDCGKSPLQWIADTGAFTITAPTNDGACTLQVEMGASAVAPTFSGWTVGSNIGDAFTTTSGNKFKIYATRIHSVSSYTVQALQ